MSSAQDNGNAPNADGGQQSFQGNAGGGVSLSGMTAPAAEASPQGFVNFMNSASAPTAPAVQQVAVQIAQNANSGLTTFTMQLEPAELGRLEVRLKFDRDGGIKAHLIADKPETLSMLRQDQAQIHRLLQQTGLNADDNSLSFDLRQQGQQPGAGQSYDGAGQPAAAAAGATPTDYLSAKISVEAMGYIRQDGVNIMV
jgi:flagellar hook-length control protein FliK